MRELWGRGIRIYRGEDEAGGDRDFSFIRRK